MKARPSNKDGAGKLFMYQQHSYDLAMRDSLEVTAMPVWRVRCKGSDANTSR